MRFTTKILQAVIFNSHVILTRRAVPFLTIDGARVKDLLSSVCHFCNWTDDKKTCTVSNKNAGRLEKTYYFHLFLNYVTNFDQKQTDQLNDNECKFHCQFFCMIANQLSICAINELHSPKWNSEQHTRFYNLIAHHAQFQNFHIFHKTMIFRHLFVLFSPTSIIAVSTASNLNIPRTCFHR